MRTKPSASEIDQWLSHYPSLAFTITLNLFDRRHSNSGRAAPAQLYRRNLPHYRWPGRRVQPVRTFAIKSTLRSSRQDIGYRRHDQPEARRSPEAPTFREWHKASPRCQTPTRPWPGSSAPRFRVPSEICRRLTNRQLDSKPHQHHDHDAIEHGDIAHHTQNSFLRVGLSCVIVV